MTEEAQSIEIDVLIAILEMLTGSKLAVVNESLREREIEKALRRSGEIDAYRLIQQIVRRYRDTGELPEFTAQENFEAFCEVTRALERAGGATEPRGDPDLGVQ